MTMSERKFQVCGTDDEGDLHTLHTDDRDRAEAMKAKFAEDLKDVQLREREGVTLHIRTELAEALAAAVENMHTDAMDKADVALAQGKGDEASRHSCDAADWSEIWQRLRAILPGG
jgi:hypothetical protein